MDEAILDPRKGDIEDDASSTKKKSLLSLGGTMLLEISVLKLGFAVLISIVIPALLLGASPLILSAWSTGLRRSFLSTTGVGAALLLTLLGIIGWFGWRPLLRIIETNFWSLNALFIQPGYTFCREALQHIGEKALRQDGKGFSRARLRAIAAICAGLLLCLGAAFVVWLVWPQTRWFATAADLARPSRFIVPMLANAVFAAAAYLAMASLAWGFADATMPPVLDLDRFATPGSAGRHWRVVHLSDIHIVGEPYGMRVESGRLGPSGNDRLRQVMARIAEIDAGNRIDLVLISGDMTDAGRSSEWIEFFTILDDVPSLRDRIVILPGNHDVNIVDRANPAKMDLPFSPNKRLRQLRTLSAMKAVQGQRALMFNRKTERFEAPLSQWIAPYASRIVGYADAAKLRQSRAAGMLWQEAFPMVIAPAEADGLGVLVLDSNAETHFSFTNALGLISTAQALRIAAAVKQFPDARWIVALHHHLIEYPMPVKAFSDRVGTALVNGSWFIRVLNRIGPRVIAMHGHRHVDWIGRSGDLTIVSAPSPVMEALDGEPTYFYLHTLFAEPEGRLGLGVPERIEITGLWAGR